MKKDEEITLERRSTGKTDRYFDILLNTKWHPILVSSYWRIVIISYGLLRWTLLRTGFSQ